MLALLRRVSPFRVNTVRAFSTTRPNAAHSDSIQDLADLVEETQSRLEEEAGYQIQQTTSCTWLFTRPSLFRNRPFCSELEDMDGRYAQGDPTVRGWFIV